MSIEAMKYMKARIEALKRLSDNGRHLNILGLSAGACWELAIELEQFITTIEQAEFDAAHEALEKQAGIHVSQQSAMKQAQALRELADRFSEGWHDGIKIDASDIMLLAMAASTIEQMEKQEPVAWWKQYRDGSVELNEARTFIAEDAIATGRRPLVFGDATPPAAQRQSGNDK